MRLDETKREWVIVCGLMVFGACVFLPGIGWGLPTRKIDSFLFGSAGRAWDAKRIASSGQWKVDPARAADADANPLAERDRVVVLNDTPAKQAEIIRRYRIFPNHPDEMLTFMALASMPKRRYDPGMYQYGGVWIYPIGGLVGAAGAMRLVTLRADLDHYLDRPEDFGELYVLARFYSAGWGLVGVWAVYRLGRRLYGGWVLPAGAGACFALMPVVVNGAHEVKPHLAGAVLVLLAALAAVNYVQRGTARWWVITGVTCGLAVGMVLTSFVAFAVIPAMAMLRRESWRRRLGVMVAAGGVGLAAYCVTNPYVPIGLLRADSPLRTNLRNLREASALFGRANDRGAVVNSAVLIGEGTSLPLAVFGVVGLAAMPFAVRRRRAVGDSAADDLAREVPSSGVTAAVVLGAPVLLSLVQFVAAAAGKAGEFGRFAVLPDVALMLCAVMVVRAAGTLGRSLEVLGMGVLAVLTGIFGLAYVAGFVEDRNDPHGTASRMVAARRLAELAAPGRDGAMTLAVVAEPAPYSLPPVDLTKWQLVLLPVGVIVPSEGPPPEVIVRAVDAPSEDRVSIRYERVTIIGSRPWFATRISWADKPFEILVRRDLITPPRGNR